MTQLTGEKKQVATFTQAVLLLMLLMAFVLTIVYMASGKDWFGDYQQPIITGSPMLVTQDDALLIFLPGSTYYKFPNKAPAVTVVEPVVPAITLPTAIPPKAQP